MSPKRKEHPIQIFANRLPPPAVGSESYVSALTFYNTVKRAAKDGVPGAQAIYDRLKVRFNA